jgi:hypothetical protein
LLLEEEAVDMYKAAEQVLVDCLLDTTALLRVLHIPLLLALVEPQVLRVVLLE